MQIFAPYPSFIDISNCLDPKRLNKQKIEIWQILKCLEIGPYQCKVCKRYIDDDFEIKKTCLNDKDCIEIKTPWYNHPATQAVKNYELFFIDYALEIADSCLKLGYKDTLIPKIQAFKEIFKGEYKKPWYWGDNRFHDSHKSNLLRKNKEYYGKFNWKVAENLEYWWPNKHLDFS